MPLSKAVSAQAGAAFNPPKCSKGPSDLELRARYLENNLIKERLPGGGDDGDDCTLPVPTDAFVSLGEGTLYVHLWDSVCTTFSCGED